jgi:AcrR family transcriptional regulator
MALMDSAPSGDTPRDRILAAARRIVTSRGLQELSVQTVATEAGVTKSAISYHFGSKDGLVLELIGELADQESRRAREDVGRIEDPAERFSAYLALYRQLVQTSDHWRLAFALWPTSHLDEKTRMFARSAAADLEALHLPPDDPSAQALQGQTSGRGDDIEEGSGSPEELRPGGKALRAVGAALSQGEVVEEISGHR